MAGGMLCKYGFSTETGSLVCVVLCCSGQAVVAIIRHHEFGSYLMVVLSALFSFFFAWEVLFVKGFVRMYQLNKR
jgi:hypothetical protein